jgi:hypothetical protein
MNKHLICTEEIDKVVYKPSKLINKFIWKPERPEKTIKKGLIKKENIIVQYYKPEGFYENGEYTGNFIPKNNDNYLIDLDNKIISTRAEIYIRYKNTSSQYFYYNTNEEANKVFTEFKSITNLFEIESL